MDFFLIFQNVAVLFLLIIIGFIAGRVGLISLQGQNEITRLVVSVTLPATIIMAIQRPYEAEKMITSLQIFGLMVLSYAILLAISYVMTRRYRLPANQQDVLLAGAVFANGTFMGFPVVLSLFGEEALFYTAIGSGIFMEIFAWTVGVYLISRNSLKPHRGGLKKVMFNPAILAVAIGLTLFFLEIRIPKPFSTTLSMLAAATSPLAMLMVGCMLSRSDIKSTLKNPILYLTSFFKLLLNPLIILLLLRLMGVRGMALTIPVVIIAMPTAANVGMLSDRYDNDYALASQQIFLSSLFSLVTIPIIVMLVTR